MSTPRKRFEAAFTGGLLELGFRKRAGTKHTIKLSPTVLGYVGLNTGTQFSRVGDFEVAGIVGIRHQEIERIVADLDGDAFHPYMPPSVVRWVTYLNPKAITTFWNVNAANADEIAREACEEVRLYGLPFMQYGSTLPGLIEYLGKLYGHEDRMDKVLPVALVLNGEPEIGLATVSARLLKLGDSVTPWAQEFRLFAQRFKVWVNERNL